MLREGPERWTERCPAGTRTLLPLGVAGSDGAKGRRAERRRRPCSANGAGARHCAEGIASDGTADRPATRLHSRRRASGGATHSAEDL